MDKVYRNVKLKGIISKDRALQLVGVKSSIDVEIKGFKINICKDDNYDVMIDYYDEWNELAGGAFDYLGSK